MIILLWNARGLGSPRAFNSLLSIQKEYKPDLLFLMETKSNQVRMEALRVKLDFAGKLVVNSIGKSGGLCLFWGKNVQVVLLSFSRDHIDVRIESSGRSWWRLTGFYGVANVSQRGQSWELLRRLAGMYSLPWACVGDFNEVLCMSEKLGGGGGGG